VKAGLTPDPNTPFLDEQLERRLRYLLQGDLKKAIVAGRECEVVQGEDLRCNLSCDGKPRTKNSNSKFVTAKNNLKQER
jgi:hypothetical protein